MEQNRKLLKRLLLDAGDNQRAAKLATKIKRDEFFFTLSLIWLAVCIVVSLYLIIA
jgi:hypothetical protein